MSMNWTLQINAIANWQLATGNSGAPPKAVNARLANWVRWAARHARANPALAAEMDALGIPLERPKHALRQRDLSNAKHLGMHGVEAIGPRVRLQ